MQWDIGMPNLGHTAESGVVQEWHRAVGERIAKGEILLTVESDKAAVEVEAPATGYLRCILHDAGAELPVGAPLAVLTATLEEAFAPPGNTPAPDMPASSTAPARPASTGPETAPGPAAPWGPRLRSTPLARRMMAEAGLDAETVHARTGADPIKRRHVEVSLAAASPAAAPAPAAARRAIARHVTEAWAVPTVRLVRRLEAGGLRDAARAAGATLTAALMWHLAGCLRRHPAMAAHWSEAGPQPQPSERINMAVDTPRGVLMPAIDAGAAATLGDLDKELRRIAAAARSGATGGLDLSPAGFALSNLGPLGIDQFDPILYAPQVAILGLGRLQQRLELTPAGILAREEITACLVIDHRALDGADGARFLATLQESLTAMTEPA